MTKQNTFYSFILFFIVLTLVYANHFDNAFHFDDIHTIVNNIYIRDLSNWKKFFTDATTFSSLPTNQTYRPISTLSLAFDYWLGGGYKLIYFHVSTYLWYMLQLGLMFLFFCKVFSFASSDKFKIRLISFLAVAFYGFHTANAETINYIIARADVFSAVFTIMAMVIYCNYPHKRNQFLYLIPFIIGILAKQPTIMLLPILFLYIYLFELNLSIWVGFTNQLKTHFFVLLKKIIPLFICVLIMLLFVGRLDSSTLNLGAGDPWLYRFTQPYIILLYTITFFLPIHLSADTDIVAATSFYDPRIYLGFIFLSVLLFLAFYCTRKNTTKPIAFGIFWYLFSLMPTSLVPLAEVMNDHRTFFPYIGLTISISWALYLLYLKFSQKYSLGNINLAFTLLITFAISLNAYGTFQRNIVWNTEASLWYDVTHKSPKNGRGLMNYGLELMAIGKYEEAEDYFLKALKLTPYYSNLHTNLGIVSNALGKKSEAEKYFKNGIEYSRGTQASYLFYGSWLLNEGRLAEAKANYLKGLTISPNDITIRYKLMDVYNNIGDKIKLKELANQTLAIIPNDSITLGFLNSNDNKSQNINKPINNGQSVVNLINQSLIEFNNKNFEKCIALCNEVLAIDPKNVIAFNNICAAYNSMGNFKEGKKAGEMAVKLDPSNQLAKNNLKWAVDELRKTKN